MEQKKPSSPLFPFTVVDGKTYVRNFNGEICSGPVEYYEIHSGLLYFVVESKDKKYFVDLTGKRLTGENITFNSGDDCNGYILFQENGKWGFIHVDSDATSPVEYDDIEPIELASPVYVKKGDEWGFLAEDFTFIPQSLVDEDSANWDDIFWFGAEP